MIRYGLLLVFLIVVIVSLSGKGVSRKSFESVSAAVSSSIRTDKCIKDSERYLKKYFGLNADDYDGVLIYIPATNMYANEVLLIKLKDTSQADTVSAAIEKRIDSQINIFEGYAPLDVIIDQAKYQILNKKKGEVAVEKMKACGNDVNRMVSELGAESTTVSDITIDSRVLGNFGVEADIVGTLLGMKEGEEVGPIAGNSSAFILKNVRFAQPAATTDYTDIIREKSSQFTNKVTSGVYNALRNQAKIKDNRTEIF